MSDERVDFRPLRKLNGYVQRAGFFTRRIKGCGGIEVAINGGDSAAAKRLIEHVQKELAKRDAAGTQPKSSD
jgi:hypothetical protein